MLGCSVIELTYDLFLYEAGTFIHEEYTCFGLFSVIPSRLCYSKQLTNQYLHQSPIHLSSLRPRQLSTAQS